MLKPQPIAPLKLAVYADRLQQALKAAMLAHAEAPTHQIALDFYDSHADLVQPFMEQWAIVKLTGMIRHQQRKAQSANPRQLAFEESLGFTRLPVTFKNTKGEPIQRAQATIGLFKDWLERQAKQKSRAYKQAEAAVALMGKYTSKEPRITWKEVCRRESKQERP